MICSVYRILRSCITKGAGLRILGLPLLTEVSVLPPSFCGRRWSCLLIFSEPFSKSTQSQVKPIASPSRNPVKTITLRIVPYISSVEMISKKSLTCLSVKGVICLLYTFGSLTFLQGFFEIISFSTACSRIPLKMIYTFLMLFGDSTFPFSFGSLRWLKKRWRIIGFNWLRLYLPIPGRICLLICALYPFSVEYFLSKVYSLYQRSIQSLKVILAGSR